jgi:hypothetical protein
MRKIFILTDLMFSGQHLYFEKFLRDAKLENTEITCEPEYWNLHNHRWEEFDALYCIIDLREQFIDNQEFLEQMHSRLRLMKQNGFKFILACPWESQENVLSSRFHKQLAQYGYKQWSGGTTWFWFWMRQKYEGKSIVCDHSHKPYQYLYLNKQPRRHRVMLWNKLKEKNLLDQSLTSFLGLSTPVRLKKEYELPDVDPENYPLYGRDQDIFIKPYEDTACSLISETNDGNEIFITEKLWKPIMCGQFFIVHGSYLYLQKIKELGFKTFSSYFDESYDLESNPVKRVEKLVSLIEDLKVFDWKDAYMSSKKIRQHNNELFWSDKCYTKEIAEVVKDLLDSK